MALLIRPLFTQYQATLFTQHQATICRGFSMATVLAGRKRNDKLDVPKDKNGIIIGKRKQSVYYPKEGVSDKTHPIHVKWQRPVSIQTCNPEISGDEGGLESLGLSSIDVTQPPIALQGSHALAVAPEEVKRVTSLDFARRRDLLDKLSQEVVKSVQRHPRDFSSIEVCIALKTVKIRNAQHELIKQWPYKNQPMKHHLTHMVSSRRNMIRILRESDYKKYEWLLEKLKLLYKPMPWDAEPGTLNRKENIERKKSIEKLTDMWCDELQRNRLTAYRKKLEEQQPEFLRKKASTLEKIMNTERKLGIEITVTEEEVEECKKKAAEIEERLMKEKEEEEEYLIFKPEVVREDNIYIGR